MRPEAVAYQDLIESLADGHELDWGALEAQARTEVERRKYRNLRLVARVAELHRTLSIEAAAEPALPLSKQPAAERPTTWGHLQITKRLAAGSFGELYVAHDPQLDRDVALKLLRADASARPLTQRLLNEAQTLARVRHHNVVDVHGADVRDGRAGLWMELVDGQTLDAWIREHGTMGAGEVTGIGRDLCNALAAVHAAGLVHSDVKPQNVMRETGGRTVLMDFGAGRAQGSAVPVSGTPMFFAPEVLAGGPPDARSDIYSLGVLLFHLLTKRYPTPASDLPSLRQAHADGARVYLRDIRADLPQSLVDCIERALEADPAMRYQSAGAMERALAGRSDDSKSRPVPLGPILGGLLAVAAALLVAIGLPRLGSGPILSSLAVMPFTPLMPETSYLSEGVSSEVVRELQRFDVRLQYGTTRRPTIAAASIPPRLATDAVVRGAVADANGSPQLTVSISRAGAPDFWSRTYPFRNAASGLGREIAVDLAAALKLKRREGSYAPSYEPNPDARELYLRGRALFEQRSDAPLRRSIEFFEQAAARDPLYAAPWAGMADSYLALGVSAFGPLSPLEARRAVKRSVMEALQRDPDSVEAHTSLAFATFFHDWDWAAAEQRFKKALDLNPQYALAHHWYANHLNAVGRQEEAMVEIRKAEELEPMSLIINRDIGWYLFFQRRYDEAIAQLEGTLKIDPGYSAARTLLARALAERGRDAEALEHLRQVPTTGSSVVNLAFTAYVYAKSGNKPAADALLAKLRTVKETYIPPYYFALAHAAQGETDLAIAELERAFREQDSTLVSVRVDPRFESLHGMPGYQAVVKRMQFPPLPH
jgi:serine/threonine-protein kinase